MGLYLDVIDDDDDIFFSDLNILGTILLYLAEV
jgi:hypothetical protein